MYKYVVWKYGTLVCKELSLYRISSPVCVR